MTGAMSWFLNTLTSFVSSFNFQITVGQFTFGLLDFLVATFLLGIVVRNFVHTAR